MTSAFKNFFITFIICLLVFGFLGFQYAYPWLQSFIDFSDMGKDTSEEVSEEVSGDVSEESSVPVIEDNYDENGDIFTAVILCADSHNRALNIAFIDANGKTKQYIYCPILSSVKSTNEIGVNVPVGDLFSTMEPTEIAQCVSAMTGIQTDYCLRFSRDDLAIIASMIPGASVTLNEDITFINPGYKDYVPQAGVPYPDDYYISISNVDGRVLLNEKLNGRSKLEWLLEYNPNSDGGEYNALYSLISKSLIRQFFENESSTMSTEAMSRIINCCDTNLTTDKASTHLATIFSYDDYTRHEVSYPANWESAVVKLRELDGRYEQ